MSHTHPRLTHIYVVEWHRTHYGKPETVTKMYRQHVAATELMTKLGSCGYDVRLWAVDVDPETWRISRQKEVASP